MGRILSAFLMLGISSMCGAQIYKYLGIEDGLSNRRIYRIQKDGRGYMWFLTQEGMDRYDGKRIRHYTVLDGNLKVAPQVNLNWLYTDTENTLWVVGRKGRIFHYDTLHDRFRMVYGYPVFRMTSPRACSVTPIWTVGTAYGSVRVTISSAMTPAQALRSGWSPV